MKKIEEAIIYATVMHQGKVRKLGSIPYILHPLEVAQILSTMTDDQDIITAGILHDIVEDTDGTLKEIEKRFGERVALLVSSESENDYPGESRSESWRRRKEEALKVLQDTDDQGIRMLWLADKLSNISKLIDLVMIFHFYRYVRITLDFKGKLADWADKGIPILMALETIVILSNIFYPLTFMIDADGFYQATGASSLEDIYLAVASLISTVVIIRSESPRSQKIAALTFIFLPVVNYATMGGEFGNASQYGMVLMSLIIIFCIIFKGDKIFVYTDGVPEATNADKELFGTDRMIDALNSNNKAIPKDVLSIVRKAVDKFVGSAEQFDDLTMVCVEYRGVNHN